MTSLESNPTAAPSAAAAVPVITPQTGTVGATITGINLRVEQSAGTKRLLDRALHEHGVLFVHFDGFIEDADHKRFAAIFGELHESYFNRGTGDPYVSVLDSERTGSPSYGTDRWHTDASVVAQPPLAASLRAITLPRTGGDTMWASMYAAYEALSSHYQRLLEGLEALHSSEALYRARPAAREANLYGEQQTAVHPVVVRDPVTNRPALYVNSGYTERILGLTDHENDSLLRMLFDHVNTPDFHVRLEWDTHTVVVWEERITQHRAINDYTGHRVLHRIVVDGDRPEAYNGNRSEEAER
ncbi:TauD/TfdA dioxygenase family protein [Nocardia pseudovaccinii]|uniref:TauD/TfdA dioxygenase family protein n=1 Tax=Nocardia pseudovaccinii TaxID=189540 RepID=UPI0007A396DF|nr:TauD/TfdA family dioxygenase [Nocardia pseudovaccinii]